MDDSRLYLRWNKHTVRSTPIQNMSLVLGLKNSFLNLPSDCYQNTGVGKNVVRFKCIITRYILMRFLK